ncbi:DUF1285 domain-containing protein [Alteromonas facilis]|uniref:DUF1285 domain-containing protein n=1 Tax=Alteromonas facilis TaxID=2048004 RepID=UPI000C290866|nr:DUF1285 domain-containing protein [Alteromonas facilis]
MDLNQLQKSLGDNAAEQSLPPVERWNPAFCGDIDINIARNGQWFYMKSPIGRKALVRLFSTIIKREDDEYFLVTPVEKVRITVEDVPFVITEWEQQDEKLVVKTQTDDVVVVGEQHPVELRYDEASQTHIPYVNVRRNLWARIHQNIFYQWAEIARLEEQDDGSTEALLMSGDYEFSIGQV